MQRQCIFMLQIYENYGLSQTAFTCSKLSIETPEQVGFSRFRLVLQFYGNARCFLFTYM